MYPSNNECLGNETMSSHSKAVIGILIITLTVMIGLSLLGVAGYVAAKNDIQEDEMSFLPEKKSSEIKSSEGTSDAATSGSSDESVPEGYKGMYGPFDVMAGELTLVGGNIPDVTDPTYQLPLCITQEWLDQWYIDVQATGGYIPEGGMLIIKQGSGEKESCHIVKIEANQLLSPASCCVPKTYRFTFKLVCGRPICLESNNVPDLSGSDFWLCPGSCDGTLDKEVYFDVITKWSGCHLESQEFLVILAHKVMSQNPQLSMRDTSPV